MHSQTSIQIPLEPTFTHTAVGEQLMPHQKEVIGLMCVKRVGGIFHEQGTGKTITGILLALSAIQSMEVKKPVLIIVPPSLRVNWRIELKKWASHLTVTEINNKKPLDIAPHINTAQGQQVSLGTVKNTSMSYQGIPDTDIILATDGCLVGYQSWLTGGWKQFSWDEDYFDAQGNLVMVPRCFRYFGRGVGAVIVDECQRVSNGRAGRSGAFGAICAGLPSDTPKFLLSGTPLTKHRVQLSHLMQALDVFDCHKNPAGAKTERMDKADWLNHFAPIVQNRFGARGVDNTEQLHAEMFSKDSGWAHRVLRDDVLDLPNLGRAVFHAEMDGEYLVKYLKAERDLSSWLTEKFRGDYARVERSMKVEALSRLRELRALAGRAKVKAVLAEVELLLSQGEQVLVSCTTNWTRETIQQALVAKKWSVVGIHGSMTSEQKQVSVETFQKGGWLEDGQVNPDGAQVAVVNALSGGVGFTMTSGRHHLSAEIPWSSSDLVQLESRLMRLGQTRDTLSTVMVAVKKDGSETIDGRLYRLCEAKYSELRQVLDGVNPESMVEDSDASILQSLIKELLGG